MPLYHIDKWTCFVCKTSNRRFWWLFRLAIFRGYSMDVYTLFMWWKTETHTHTHALYVMSMQKLFVKIDKHPRYQMKSCLPFYIKGKHRMCSFPGGLTISPPPHCSLSSSSSHCVCVSFVFVWCHPYRLDVISFVSDHYSSSTPPSIFFLPRNMTHIIWRIAKCIDSSLYRQRCCCGGGDGGCLICTPVTKCLTNMLNGYELAALSNTQIILLYSNVFKICMFRFFSSFFYSFILHASHFGLFSFYLLPHFTCVGALHIFD